MNIAAVLHILYLAVQAAAMLLYADTAFREGSAMGFKPERTIYKLNFKDTILDGLVVRMRSLTVREYNEMISHGGAEGVAGILDTNRWMAELFLDKLVEWNLEGDDGQPVPKTMAALEELDRPMITQIINAWQMAMVRVESPLQNSSSSGSSSLEESLGLGGLSESPSS